MKKIKKLVQNSDLIQFNTRARTMTRFDGFENIGLLIGTALSPVIIMYLGKFACFILQVGCVFLGTLYIALFLPQISSKNENLVAKQEDIYLPKRTPLDTFKEFVVIPLVDLVKCLCKKRPRGLHWLILLQISVYALYTFALEEYHLRYLFMSKMFHGFGPINFAIFNVYRG